MQLCNQAIFRIGSAVPVFQLLTLKVGLIGSFGKTLRAPLECLMTFIHHLLQSAYVICTIYSKNQTHTAEHTSISLVK